MNEYLSSISTCSDYIAHKSVLSEYIAKENYYREVFAQPDKDPNNECLIHPENLVLPVFDNIENFKYRELYPEEANESKLFKLDKRCESGKYSVNNRDVFASNFNILTEGMFDDFNWSNVVAAGGCVSACLLPVPEECKTKKEKRKYFHDTKYGGIDVDLFIYGLDEEKAKEKMVEIAQCITGNCLYPVRFVRTSHSITIVNQYPYINIQIILRLYKSAPEVIMGFDIDSCALYYDGNNVYCLPRSHHAIVSQYNTIDMSRRSPTYESRLAKYADRGYEILYPELNRDKIDPLIFEKGFEEIQGLSRLLVLEKYKDPSI